MRKLVCLGIVVAFAAVPAVSAMAARPTKTVTVGNYFFKAKKMTIRRGTRVTWKWHSFGIKHNVTVTRGPVKFHSRNLGGGTFSKVLTRKGTYHLICTLHPGVMKETIIVR